MDLIENLMRDVALTVNGAATAELPGARLRPGQPFNRWTMQEAVLRFNPGSTSRLASATTWPIARKVGGDVKPDYGAGKLLTEISRRPSRRSCSIPTFITEYPTEVSPLARRNDDNPESHRPLRILHRRSRGRQRVSPS